MHVHHDLTVFRDEKKDFAEWNALYGLLLKSKTKAVVKKVIDKVSNTLFYYCINSVYNVLFSSLFVYSKIGIEDLRFDQLTSCSSTVQIFIPQRLMNHFIDYKQSP